MDLKNIPKREKFDALVKGLTDILPLAEELSRDPVQSQSPHIAAILGRVRGAIDSASWHVKALAELPEPKLGTRNSELGTPTLKTATDAKAGAPAN